MRSKSMTAEQGFELTNSGVCVDSQASRISARMSQIVGDDQRRWPRRHQFPHLLAQAVHGDALRPGMLGTADNL
jgi:hypothetical protein